MPDITINLSKSQAFRLVEELDRATVLATWDRAHRRCAQAELDELRELKSKCLVQVSTQQDGD